MHRYRLSAAALTILLAGFTSPTRAAGPVAPLWSPTIIATGQQREQIRALPIEQRPNRPLHFYGNSVRRMHQRGMALPTFGGGIPQPQRLLMPRP